MGVDDEWVISGSDCGYIYIWSASTGNCHASFKADSYVVNCLEPNAQHFLTFATSGIDNDIKLWSPTRENPVCLEYTDLQRMESNVEGVLSASIGRKSRSTAARLMRRIALVGGAQE